MAAPGDAAQWLLDRRRDRQVVDRIPEDLRPHDLDAAYAVQRDFVARSGRAISGYKLGGTTAVTRAAFGVESLFYGTLLGSMVVAADQVVPANAVYRTIAEAELSFVAARDLPWRPMPYSVAEVLDAVSAVHVSVEIPSTCLADAPAAGLPSLIADDCAAGLLVLGPAVPDWRDRDLCDAEVSIACAGTELASGSTSAIIGGPTAALAAFIELRRSQRQDGWRAGDVVATGGATPCIPVPAGETVTVRFAGLSEFKFRFAG